MAEKTPEINSSRLRRLLLSSHSRGAMLHAIGSAGGIKPPTNRAVTPARAALFGAPMPKGAK